MGTKRKSRGKTRPNDLFERAQRSLAAGKVKVALKDAKVCFRSDPSPAHRQLLQQAYVRRIEQLHEMRLFDEARGVLADLRELGPIPAEFEPLVARLCVLLGDRGRDSAALLETDPSLLVEMADKAILDRRCPPPDDPQVKLQLEQVRQALAAVEQGEDDAAGLLVQGISRTSPLADWKLLVRGLSAFYQGDRQRTEENWRRLDPARPARRIAQTLLVAAGEPPLEGGPDDVARAVHKLETHLAGNQAGYDLKRLSEHWQQGQFKEFLRVLRSFRQRFARTHAKVLDDIVDLAWKRAARDGSRWMLLQLRNIGWAPRLDPRWSRALALVAETSGEYNATLVEELWVQYAEELLQAGGLREDERPVASALTYLRLARKLLELAEHNRRYFGGASFGLLDEFRQRAVRYFLTAIERCGQLAAAYHELADLHEEMEEPDSSAAVLKRLLDEKPDDFEAHRRLAAYYQGIERPDLSEPYIEALVRLKPRDARAVSLRWRQRLAMTYALVKRRQYEAARRELQQAASEAPPGLDPYVLDAHRAAVELKANGPEAADRYLKSALDSMHEPAPVWLLMSCLAARFGLPREVRKDFSSRYQQSLESKPTSQTAGRLAQFFLSLAAWRIDYTGRAGHQQLLVKYLRRAVKVQWRLEDIVAVGRFLDVRGDYIRLKITLLEGAMRQFSKSPSLHVLRASAELERGTRYHNTFKARFHAEKALEYARSEPGAADAGEWVIGQAENVIAALGYGDESRFFDDDHDDYDEDEYDDDYDDEDDDGFDGRGSDGGLLGPPDLERMIDIMEETMPPELHKQFARMAAEMGKSIRDVISAALESELESYFADSQPKPKKRQASR